MISVKDAINYGTSSSEIASKKYELINDLIGLKESADDVIYRVEKGDHIESGSLLTNLASYIDMMSLDYNVAIATKK